MADAEKTTVPADERTASGLAEMQRLIVARHKFAAAFCAARGWDMDDLTWEQIMAIRAQPGWQRPTLPETGRSGG